MNTQLPMMYVPSVLWIVFLVHGIMPQGVYYVTCSRNVALNTQQDASHIH